MADDIMAEFQSLTENPEQILQKPDLLIRATDVWRKYTGHYSAGEVEGWVPSKYGDVWTTNRMPPGYKELTDLLVLWCDASQSSIDPEPLCELVSWLEATTISLSSGYYLEPPNADEFWALMRRAVSVINRMRYAAAARSRKAKVGRPLGKKGEKRKAIEKELGIGTQPSEIAKSRKMGTHRINRIKREMDTEIANRRIEGADSDVVAKEFDVAIDYVETVMRELDEKIRRKLKGYHDPVVVASKLHIPAEYVDKFKCEMGSQTSSIKA